MSRSARSPLVIFFKLAAVILLITASFTLIHAQTTANAPVIGRHRASVINITGKSEYRKAGLSAWVALEKGQDLSAGDIVRVAAKGKVRIRIGNIGVFDVSENSEIRVVDLLRTRSGVSAKPKMTEVIRIDLNKGELRGFLTKPAEGTGAYRIHTPVAVIGVRGTTFSVLAAPAETALNLVINLFEGILEVTPKKPEIDTALLTPNKTLYYLNNRKIEDNLSERAILRLASFRREARSELAKPMENAFVPEGKASEWDIRNEIGDLIQILATDYEREDIKNFMSHVSRDFRSVGDDDGVVLDYFKLRDSLNFDFRAFDRIEFNFRVTRIKWYKETGELEAELLVRMRYNIASQQVGQLGSEVIQDLRVTVLRFRIEETADGKEEWKLVDQYGHALFGRTDPVTHQTILNRPEGTNNIVDGVHN